VRALLTHWPRVWQVLAVLGGAAVWPALPLVRRRAAPGPVRMRAALEQLGGAWIKLGQMLALRFDLLPAAYCDELFKLLNEVRPFPYAQVREIVQRELGGPPEAVFRAFAPEPFAAASIGQVHRAVLPGGQPVAVKVQRPRVRQLLQTDLALMYAVGRVLDWTRLFGATRSREVIDEFARWTADELDYLVEARQAARLYEQARGERLERIARVYRGYTTSRVLTSELLEGIPLLEVLTAVRRRDRPYLAALAARGCDLRRVVRHLDWNMLNQVFVFGCFHADLHPANLFVLPGDAIGYVDFGAVAQLPDALRQSLTRYGWLLFRRDVEAATGELLRWLPPASAGDAALARQRLVRLHEAFLYDLDAAAGPEPSVAPPGRAGGAEGEGATANPYSRLAVGVLQTVRQQGLALAPGIVAYLKMLVTLGALRHQLAPDYDLPRHARRFFERLLRQQGAEWLDPRHALDRLYDGGLRVRRTLDFVELLQAQAPLLTAAGGAYFGVRRRLEAGRRRVVRLGLAALVVGAGLYVLLARPDTARAVLPAQVPTDWAHAGLLALLLALLAALVLQGRDLSRGE
jgi:predicted unusual protein kinase regulating ubiquinone biosynthesis (AarF/ABC1/UbiB family)